MSVLLGFSAPAFAVPKRVAQVPLLVAVVQLLPEMTVPATLVMATLPLVKTLPGLVVVAVKLASVPPPIAVVSTPSPRSPKRIVFVLFERSLWSSVVSVFTLVLLLLVICVDRQQPVDGLQQLAQAARFVEQEQGLAAGGGRGVRGDDYVRFVAAVAQEHDPGQAGEREAHDLA